MPSEGLEQSRMLSMSSSSRIRLNEHAGNDPQCSRARHGIEGCLWKCVRNAQQKRKELRRAEPSNAKLKSLTDAEANMSAYLNTGKRTHMCQARKMRMPAGINLHA